MKIRFIVAVSITALVFSALAPVFAQNEKYKVQPTDVLKVNVHEQPDLDTKTRVSQDGYISFPLLGKVYVKGLTVQEIEKQIKDLLEKDYLVNAQVVAFIEEYHTRQVSVIGEVHNPGKFDLPEEKAITLLEAIAMAGGFTKDAKDAEVKVIREKNGKKETVTVNVKDITEKGEKNKDIVLEPEDVVFVPESFF
jgi:polysaccharide biosynthesis/export protein